MYRDGAGGLVNTPPVAIIREAIEEAVKESPPAGEE